MKKIIIKTALITIAEVIAAGCIVFGLWLLISPQTMATACERTGNYSFAVKCAELRYTYTGEISDLARLTDDCIFAGDDKSLADYGGKLLLHKDYASLCEERDRQLSEGAYAQYTLSYNIYLRGQVSCAQYRDGDNIQNAIKTANGGGVQSFNKLVVAVAENKDGDSAKELVSALEEYGDSALGLIGILNW